MHDDDHLRDLSLARRIAEEEAAEAEFLGGLSDQPAYSERDLWLMFEAAVESTAEGNNGEWGATGERMRLNFRQAMVRNHGA